MNLFKKIKINLFIVLSIICTNYTITVPNNTNATKYVSLVKSDTPHWYGGNYFKFDITKNTSTWSLDYLRNFNCRLNEGQVNDIGINKIEKMANLAVSREIGFKKNKFFVFYHGQKLEFLLFQDLFAFLYKKMFDLSLKNFFALRIPDLDFEKYDNAFDFLKDFDYEISDYTDPERKLLLSVTTCFFGANINYFLGSYGCADIGSINLIKRIFKTFGLKNLFKKYKSDLRSLNSLLWNDFDGKTGLLLQIFIPENLLDTIVYKSEPGGTPAYGSYIKKSPRPTQELADYSDDPNVLDYQFRIYLGTNLFLPENGIKMFRYYNKTASNIKKYKTRLRSLLKELNDEINRIDSNLNSLGQVQSFLNQPKGLQANLQYFLNW